MLDLADRALPDDGRLDVRRAVVATRLERYDAAVEALRRAVAAGVVTSADVLEADPDLAPLRDLPAFRALVAGLRGIPASP